jgi:hypothetical protein
MPPRKKATGTKTQSRRKQPEAAVQPPESEAPPTTPEEKKPEPQEEFSFERPIGDTIEGMPYFLKAGDEISLDLRHRQFLMVPNMRLTSQQPTGTIPKGIDQEALACLRRALEHGDIVRGASHVPVFVKKGNVIPKCVALLEYDAPTMKSKVGKIVQAGLRNFVDGHHPYDLVKAMLKAEREGKSRNAHLNILKSALQYLQDDTFRRGPVGNKTFDELLEDRSRQVIEERREEARGKFKGRRPA